MTKKDFNLNVIWIAKPISLMDPELAIKLLEIIESKEVVSKFYVRRGVIQIICFLLGFKRSYSRIQNTMSL